MISNFDLFIHSMQTVQVIFLFLAAYFCILTLPNLLSGYFKHQIMRTKAKVFLLLLVGILFLALAYALKHTYTHIFGEIVPLASDIFFVISYFTLIIAFATFWFEVRKMHNLLRTDKMFFIGVISMVLIWVYYVFIKIIVPNIEGSSHITIYLTFFYPAAAAFLFISTLIIYPTYKAKIIHSPLWYLSTAVFLNFIAEMIYIYSVDVHQVFIRTIYTLTFVISGFYFFLGFYSAYVKYKVKGKKEV